LLVARWLGWGHLKGKNLTNHNLYSLRPVVGCQLSDCALLSFLVTIFLTWFFAPHQLSVVSCQLSDCALLSFLVTNFLTLFFAPEQLSVVSCQLSDCALLSFLVNFFPCSLLRNSCQLSVIRPCIIVFSGKFFPGFLLRNSCRLSVVSYQTVHY
jgi:hypothetical protein